MKNISKFAFADRRQADENGNNDETVIIENNAPTSELAEPVATSLPTPIEENIVTEPVKPDPVATTKIIETTTALNIPKTEPSPVIISESSTITPTMSIIVAETTPVVSLVLTTTTTSLGIEITGEIKPETTTTELKITNPIATTTDIVPLLQTNVVPITTHELKTTTVPLITTLNIIEEETTTPEILIGDSTTRVQVIGDEIKIQKTTTEMQVKLTTTYLADNLTTILKPQETNHTSLIDLIIPASIQNLFQGSNLYWFSGLGVLCIVTPLFIFLVIFLMCRRKKSQFKHRYSEFNEMFKNDNTATMIRKIRRTSSTRSSHSFTRQNTTIQKEDGIQNNANFSRNTRHGSNKFSVNPLFQDELENTHM